MNSVKEIVLDCKYLGKVYSPIKFQNGKKFPFFDDIGLKKIARQLFISKYNELEKNKSKGILRVNENIFMLGHFGQYLLINRRKKLVVCRLVNEDSKNFFEEIVDKGVEFTNFLDIVTKL